MSNPKFRAAADAAIEDTEESVENRLHRLRADAEAIVAEADELPENIRTALDGIEDRIAELYDVVSAQAAYSVETVEEIIETRPWLSVAVAFGAGILATLVLTPPRRPKRNWYGW